LNLLFLCSVHYYSHHCAKYSVHQKLFWKLEIISFWGFPFEFLFKVFMSCLAVVEQLCDGKIHYFKSKIELATYITEQGMTAYYGKNRFNPVILIIILLDLTNQTLAKFTHLIHLAVWLKVAICDCHFLKILRQCISSKSSCREFSALSAHTYPLYCLNSHEPYDCKLH